MPDAIADAGADHAAAASGTDAGADGGDASPDGSGEGGTLDPATACVGNANKLVLTGDDEVHSGPPLEISGGVGWGIDVQSSAAGAPSYLYVSVGSNWKLQMSTAQLGRPLSPGTYTDAQRAASAQPNHPGLDVSGDGVACATVTGQFTVLEIASTPPAIDGGSPTLTSFTAYFEQHCEGGPRANYGCIHVQP